MPSLRSSIAPPTLPRAARLAALESGEFDVLVIGGGITGCGIARDAVLRGLRVALVEKADLASGTSSRSSRLVHGGVRYLEHGHLRLVFEASAERRRLLRLAPHLVRPLEFTWPVYRGARLPRWKLGAGLALYDALALFRNVGRHRQLGRDGVLAREPGLRGDGLVGGATYFDAATDDARLTLANAIDAAEAGAILATYVRADLPDSPHAGDVGATDVLTGRALRIRARVVVRALGPWTTGEVRGSTGVHVTLRRERVGNTGAVTMIAPQDGRVMFTLPAGTHTIVGTTETPTRVPPDEVRATEADIAYLLEAANHHFPAAQLKREDVVSAWAGVRPLVAGAGSLGGASREHAVHASGAVVTITGGKLTTYRVMAADVMAAVERLLAVKRTPSPTRDRVLPGGEVTDVAAEVARIERDTGLGAASAARLVGAYGARWPHVWAMALSCPGGTEPLQPGLPYLRGEVPYAARHELATTVGDVLIRRTHLAFESRDQGRAVAAVTAALLAPVLGWSEAQQGAEVARYEREVEGMFGVDA